MVSIALKHKKISELLVLLLNDHLANGPLIQFG